MLLPKGTLFSEEGPEIRSVVVAEGRALEGWLPDNFRTAGGGLSCIGLGEDGSTYLASNLLDPAARAQQPEHTDFSPSLWDWDGEGVRGTAARMEQLCVHALFVQLYAPELVAEGEIPPPPGAKGFGRRAALGYGRQESTPQRAVCLGKTTSSSARPAVLSAATGAPSRPLPGPRRSRWSGWSQWRGEGVRTFQVDRSGSGLSSPAF